MFVVMPVVVAVVAQVSNLPEAVKIALVALAIAPVPPILPRRELKAGGHADYAVGLLAVGALIAIVYVPLAVEILDRIFGRHGDVSPLAIGKIVLITILAPLLIGMAIRQWAPSAAAKGAGPVLTIGMILLVAACIPLLMATWEAVVALFGDGTVLIMALVAAGGLLLGHALGGPRPEHRIVLALSTASRHPAVALAVATSGVMQTKSGACRGPALCRRLGSRVAAVCDVAPASGRRSARRVIRGGTVLRTATARSACQIASLRFVRCCTRSKVEIVVRVYRS